MFSPRYTAQLNDNNLIVIEDIIEAYKTGAICLSHKDAYAGLDNWQHNRTLAISRQIAMLYPKEVAEILDELQRKLSRWIQDRKSPMFSNKVRREASRELTERMVQEHYSAEDQFTFMMATA